MRRKIAGILSVALLATCVSGLCSSNETMAAKKVALSSKKMNVTVGKKKTVSIKNVKAKNIRAVKWTSSKKRYATVKKKTATKAYIKGVKKGKATVKVSFKMNNKNYKLSVAVTVKNNTKETTVSKQTTMPIITPVITPTIVPSPSIVPQNTASSTPTNAPDKINTPEPSDEPGVTNTPNPSDVPGSTNTPEPTDIPEDKEFDEQGRKMVQVNALNRIIEAQNLSGANISTDIDSLNYRWSEEGNLEKISWIGCNLQKDISFMEFPELQELYLSSSDITYNTKQNPRLNSIDVSGNQKLVKLRVSHSNINSLNVANCKELIELECENNNLNELDVTENTELILLKCSENNLLDLDVTNLAGLSILECYDNVIKVIDVSKNTELSILKCGSNVNEEYDETEDTESAAEKKVLDLSNNTKLEEIYADSLYLTDIKIGAIDSVKIIDISDNRIEGFDATKYPNLKAFNASYNESFTDVCVNGLMYLEELSLYATSVYELDLSGCESLVCVDVEDSDVEELDLSETLITLNSYMECIGENLGYIPVIDVKRNVLLTPNDDAVVESEVTESVSAVKVTFADEEE